MNRHRVSWPGILALALLAWGPVRAGSAIVVDGVRDPAYGAPIAVQTTQTGGFDASLPDRLHQVYGSELDAAYALLQGDSLYLMFTGNLFARLRPDEPGNYYDHLWVFIDTGLGGQDSIRADAPAPLGSLARLRFDAGFRPSHAFEVHVGCLDGGRVSYTQCTLPASGPSSAIWLGSAFVNSSVPILELPENTFHVFAAMNDSNTAGVGEGCGADPGAGAERGAEFRIPLAALGETASCLRVSAFVQVLGHHFVQFPVFRSIPDFTVLNQSLPPLPVGTCNPGAPALMDFGAFAGDQFFTVCRSSAGVPPMGPAGLALSAPWPSPAHSSVRFTIRAPAGSALECVVVDALGRRVARLWNGPAAESGQELVWNGTSDEGVHVRPGVYFVHARAQGRTVSRSAVLVGGE